MPTAQRAEARGASYSEIMRSVSLLDVPHGRLVASITKDANLSNRLLVKILTAHRAAHVLIRYGELDAQAVGWENDQFNGVKGK